MPRVTNRKLTLTPREDDDVHFVLEITYRATFSKFERNLAGLGLKFQELVSVFGADPPGSTTGTDIFRFVENLEVTPGNQEQVIDRRLVEVVNRGLLDEDPGTIIKDDDEIRARIEIRPIGIPPEVTKAFTNQVVVFEDADINV